MIIHKIGAYSELDLSLRKINAVFMRKYDANSLVVIQNHRYDNAMVLVLNGRATYYRDDKEDMAVEKDDIFFLAKGSKYQRVADPGEPFEFILISYSLSDYGQSLPVDEVNRTGNLLYYRTAFLELFEAWSKKWLGYRLRCNAMVQEIWYRLVNDVVGQSLNDAAVVKLHPAIAYMEKHYRSPVTIEELAERVNLSGSHFHRLFRETYGASPLQYLISIRIDAAKDLIRSGIHTVSEVAERVGYDDIYYFSRLFKKVTGHSPSSYYKASCERIDQYY